MGPSLGNLYNIIMQILKNENKSRYQDDLLPLRVAEVVAEGAGSRQEGRHDHQDRNDGREHRVRGPLVGRVQTGVLAACDRSQGGRSYEY